jgi:hypothetical protein
MKCTAHRTNGQPCNAPAIKGGSVCRVHGGSAPQVKRSAKMRLLELVDPALATLGRAVSSTRTGIPTAVEISAAKDILDRAGFKPVEKTMDVNVTLIEALKYGTFACLIAIRVTHNRRHLDGREDRRCTSGYISKMRHLLAVGRRGNQRSQVNASPVYIRSTRKFVYSPTFRALLFRNKLPSLM